MSTIDIDIDIIKDTEPAIERELISDMFPTIEEVRYFTDMVHRRNSIAVKEFCEKCYIVRAWLTDIDFFKPFFWISKEQYKMVADILGYNTDSTYFGAVVTQQHEVEKKALILNNKKYFFYDKMSTPTDYKKALADVFYHTVVVGASTLAINWALENGKIINKTELKLDTILVNYS